MATWTFHVDGGPKRVNHAAVCVNGVIYSFGGYCTGEDFCARRKNIDVHVFDTNLFKWSKLTYFWDDEMDVPYQRYGHTVVAYDNSAYLYGGRNETDGASEHLYRFDIATRKWHRPKVFGNVPFSRDGHSCCVVDNNMYLFAGFEENSMEFSKSVYSLNLDTNEWKLCAVSGEEPLWRDFHTATPWRHYMIVFGGRGDQYGPLHTNREVYDNGIYMFDTLDNTWTKPNVSGDKPEGRRSHNTFVYDGKLFVFGGYNSKLGRHFNDLHMYDPETKHWTRCEPCGLPPGARRRSCCCMNDNQVFIFGGTSPEKEDNAEILVDRSDLYVLDMTPSLRSLSMMQVLNWNMCYDKLPHDVKRDLIQLSQQKVLSRVVPHG